MHVVNLLYQQGLAFHRQGLLQQAKDTYQLVIQSEPHHAPALHLLGVMASQNGDHVKGLAWLELALTIEPQNPVFLSNYASTLISVKRFTEAFNTSLLAVSLKPDYFSALRNCALALVSLEKNHEAIQFIEQCIQLQPDSLEMLLLKAQVLHDIKAFTAAAGVYDRVIELKPDHVDAYFLKGNTLTTALRYEDAISSYEQVLKWQPNHAMALFNRGAAFEYDDRYPEAIQSYAHALQIDRNIPYGLGSLLHAKMLCCDWQDLDTLHQEITQRIEHGEKVAMPFGYQAICDEEASLQQCAQIYANDKYPPVKDCFTHPSWDRHPKIKLGYLCGEFREQATSILMTEVWEVHDKNIFEIYAFDNGWDDDSPRRTRINSAFDHVIDITQLTDSQAAQLIFDHQIDILVNLNGFFGRERNKVFARRPSPIQVNYLGFPGTMGCSFMNYLIADPVTIPDKSKAFYNEEVWHLPECYQPNDTKRNISSRQFSRRELGLPENGFVFCCFNNSYKITPDTFDVWMNILRKVDNSVLWLLEDSADAVHHLKKEAVQRGVESDRLVFAPRLPNDEHLARHAMADLFLDTWPYNAHTTASDALWAGLPLLTLQGKTFPGRVASSILGNMNLVELVAVDVLSYQEIAIKLAINPPMIQVLKLKIETQKIKYASPFKPITHTSDMENIFKTIYQKLLN